MALNHHDQGQLREYLLGKLSDAEQEKIEERLMVEDQLFDEFEASKDELVEEYCAGELGSTERQFFEEHFLRSVDGQQRRAFVLAMDYLQSRQPVTIDEPQPVTLPIDPPDPRPGIFQRLKDLFANQPWATATATAMVLIVAAVIGINQFRSRPAGQTFATMLQSYNQNRGEETDAINRIKLPANTAFLKLRLKLPKPAVAGTRYQAVLDDRINKKPLDVVESDSESATVVIPADLIPNRPYAVKLTITNPDGTEREPSYRFLIEAQ
ncbi:MAG TPA: hypothetical protein VJ749_11770 [Pyrinomonadaceae bacterium]|nr:hypothetical protein [Pyrinomonadaceae bacterium]